MRWSGPTDQPQRVVVAPTCCRVAQPGATHVIVGLIMLSIALGVALTGHIKEEHTEKLEVLSLYWHFVDAIWVGVFLVVYVIGR